MANEDQAKGPEIIKQAHKGGLICLSDELGLPAGQSAKPGPSVGPAACCQHQTQAHLTCCQAQQMQLTLEVHWGPPF